MVVFLHTCDLCDISPSLRFGEVKQSVICQGGSLLWEEFCMNGIWAACQMNRKSLLSSPLFAPQTAMLFARH